MATILVVDDRSSNRLFLTTLLGYGGHRLLEAVNGADALDMVRAKHPDLVITDILMPVMDGFEFVQQMRADPALLDTKVIFHTATYSEPEARKLAQSCGVRTVLPKPCEPQQVIDAVERELGAQPALHAASAPPAGAADPGGASGVDGTVSLRLRELKAAQRKFERFMERNGRSERDQRLWQDLEGSVVGLQRLASRLSGLVEIALEMMQERDPKRLIKLFFGAACEMIDTEYTALCMFGEDGQAQQHVLARNIDPAVLREPGAARAGLLGKLLGDRRVLRVHGAKMKAGAEGLPPGHPPVRSFLGVAIATRDQVYGWLYFADRRGDQEFSEEDERVAGVLAAKLALLYENTQLYDVIQRHAAKLQIEAGERKRAEAALRESEAGLRRAQSMARLAHVITRPDGSFENWSETLPELAGLEPSRTPRDTREWLAIVHAEDQQLFRDNAIDAGAKGARKELEYRLLRADGGTANIRQVMEPIEGSADPHGRKRWFNTLQDLTEQKHAADNLRESELRFRQLAENIHEVFFLIDPANTKMLYISPAYEEIWQRSVASLYANPQSWFDSIHAEDREQVNASFPEQQRTGRFDYEYRIVRPDGTLRWIHARGFPIRDKSGGLVRIAGIAEDVTESKRAADELRESERRFSSLLGTVQLVSLMLDREARITYCNDYLLRLTGWQREEVIGRNWFELFIPPEQANLQGLFADLIADLPSASHHENEILTRSGARRLIQWNNTVLRSSAGEVVGTASIGEDITDRKGAETRIRRLNRVYAVLSGINTLIVRVRDRDELFKEACRIALEAGQFAMAWIGVVERDAMMITPVAWAGADPEYMSFIKDNFSLAEGSALGDTLTARAVREKKTHFSNDSQNDPRVRFRKEHARRGSRSIAVLPLLVADEAAGVLVLYAEEAGFFDQEELKLLNELAGDISFAMQHLEALGKVEYLAFHDLLTGLPNRTVLIDRLGQILSAARRDKQLAGVMFFDLERFRLINDTLGRQFGDEFLKEVAERFKSAVRPQDTVARVGADVFAVAVGSFSQVTDATHMFSDQLIKAFSPPVMVNGQELRAVFKAGIAVFPGDGDSAETLCSNAEAALKRAKDAGERYVFYTPELNARMSESLALENKLRRALEAEEFVLHYQPKVDAKTRVIVGVEALIRWNDPKLGLVPPGKFIPLMEETGIILQAGRWALGRAVADIQAWRAKGLVAPRVAVNVSQIQLRQTDFVKSVLEALEGFGDAEHVLDLEITESMAMQNLEPTIRALQTLRGVGVETSLDDFGTGYSSLAYVARLPVAALKIDRSFVIEMVASKYARTIVETVISLAHSLGLKVIAEGVDAEEQLALLCSLGCDQVQGYLICKPVPAKQIEAMLAKA